MEFPAVIIKKMVEGIAEKANERIDQQGFENMAEKINTEIEKGVMNRKYLYETMHRGSLKAIENKEGKMKLNGAKIKVLARYLGFDSFEEFKKDLEQPISKVLRSCEGDWSCYVRQNSIEPVMFKSPVRIFIEKSEMKIKLRGPVNEYSGPIKLREGCLFATMESENGKSFHHIYRIGGRMKPKLMQGIFTGVSSSFDPIGGRVVLVRENEEYDKLKNEKIELAKINKQSSKLLRKLAAYFKTYAKNNLKNNSSMTFGIGDLG